MYVYMYVFMYACMYVCISYTQQSGYMYPAKTTILYYDCDDYR